MRWAILASFYHVRGSYALPSSWTWTPLKQVYLVNSSPLLTGFEEYYMDAALRTARALANEVPQASTAILYTDDLLPGTGNVTATTCFEKVLLLKTPELYFTDTIGSSRS